jgi:hypothetical protein
MHWILLVSFPIRRAIVVFDSSAFGLEFYTDFIELAKKNILRPLLTQKYSVEKVDEILSPESLIRYTE